MVGNRETRKETLRVNARQVVCLTAQMGDQDLCPATVNQFDGDGQKPKMCDPEHD
jgi:hypothetical protein